MELTPKLLTEEVDFRVGYRGYDRDEVDDFLERVAVAVGQLQQQLADAVDRARTSEGRLKAAQREVEDARRHGPSGADPATQAQAARESEDLNEELRRTLILAQRTADAAIREAREQATKISNEAEERARRRVADAEAEAHRKSDEGRSRLLAEIAELEGIRESFRGDVTVLERHLEAQRQQLRSTVQQLQRLLDDPNSFRIEPVPPLSGVSAPSSVREAAPSNEPSTAGAAEGAQPAERTAGARAAAPKPATSASQAPPRPAEHPPREQRPQPGPPPNNPSSSAPKPQPSQAASTPENKQATGEVTFRGATPAAAASNNDTGPQTQPISAARFEDDNDDAFLAELRRAMADEEPLGPRPTTAGDRGFFDQDDDSPRRPRFGRRR